MASIKPKKTLFYQTLSLFTKTLIVVQFITVAALAYYLLFPMLHRATKDLASVMIEHADKWNELEINQREDLALTLQKKYDLKITSIKTNNTPSTQLLPFIYFLTQSIQLKSNYQIKIRESYDVNDDLYIWVDMISKDKSVHFGLSSSRIGVSKQHIFLIVMLTSIALTIITAFLLTRRLTAPLSNLSKATQSISRGQFPKPIPEQGTEELSSLAKQFNTMNGRVQELLANRTTLLAGISHDLRTPLTQIQLALSLLPNNGGDEVLMDSIKHDLNDINDLINEVLDIGLTLSEGEPETTDINAEIQRIINTIDLNNIELTANYLSDEARYIKTYPLAFRRIIKNLLNNAILYGLKNPIHIHCIRTQECVTISIKDHGEGIPEDELERVFQPFYRLEKSRNSDTGGSGLGLALVRQLSESHQWHVSLKTTQEGGLCASLTIPIV